MVLHKPIKYRKLNTIEWIKCPNANKAARELDIHSAQVYKCCKKERSHAGGYEFEFDEEAVPKKYEQLAKRRRHEVIDGVEHTMCGNCKQMKPIELFSKCGTAWDGLTSACKDCQKYHRESKSEHYKKYRQDNKKRIAENHANWYTKNKERVIKYVKEHRQCKKEHYRLYRQSEKCKQYRREWKNNKYASSAAYRTKAMIRARIREVLKKGGKSESTIKYIGCTIEQLMCHLEKQFDEYMTWQNQGHWHIDHKIPCNAFDTSNIAEATAMWHYKNLQPMWAKDNILKSDHYDEENKKQFMRDWREFVF